MLTLEQQLANIQYALDESSIVAITNARGDIIYVNDMFCRISKYSRDELMGQNHRILNSGHHPKAFFVDMWQTIAGGGVWRGEIKNRAKDGSLYWVNTTIVPFLDDTRKPVQYVSIRHEITARKRIEEELRRLYEDMEHRVQERTAELAGMNKQLKEALFQLRESEQARSKFIATLTHDLRTPLVGQQRALELLSDAQAQIPEKFTGLIDRLMTSNQGLLDMVNLLLETYQYEAGQVVLRPEDFNVTDLLRECLGTVRPIAESKGITLVSTVPDQPVTLHADPVQLRRVVMNLLGNALENIPSGSSVRLSLLETSQGLGFEVCDNGPGIAPEVMPHLFERYHQHKHRQKKIGTGLGLFICKTILNLHGGEISVESSPATGTCFRVILPVSPGADITDGATY